MPSSSPYQNNDYQALSTYRPYRLPINEIAKASVAVDQFWKVPAQQIKSMYDNAAGLNLTLEPNKEIRNQSVEEANKQIQKLSSMNLSDPSVQKQAFSLFKDLYSDEGVMSDHQATETITRINNAALSAKQSEHGKYYSPVNHKYALTGADEFKNATDRMAGKAYLAQAKEYEEFYDPATEITGILKNCKPNTASNDIIEGMYNKTYSDESLEASKISSCMDAGLSDKAKRQLQINGAITYRNNPEALAQKYIPHLQGTRAGLMESKAAIAGILVNKDNLKNLKPEDLAKIGVRDVSELTPDILKRLQESSDVIDARVQNLDGTISKIINKDYSPIQGEDFEAIAGSMYSKDYMQNIGEGYAYDFKKNSKKVDTLQLEIFKQNQINARQEDDQQHDMQMQANKLQADMMIKMGLKKQFNLAGPSAQELIDEARVNNTADHSFSTLDEGSTYDQYTKKRVEIQQARQQLQADITQEAKQYGMPATITSIDSPEGQAWLDAYETTGKGDPNVESFIKRYKTQFQTNVWLEQNLKGIQDNVDNNPEIKQLNATIKQKIASVPPLVINNTAITAQDIINALSGEGGVLKIVKGSAGLMPSIPGVPSMGITPLTEDQVPDAYYVNGVKINNNEIVQRVQEIKQMVGSGTEIIKKKRDELLKNETVLQREGYLFPQLNDKDSPLKLRLAQEIGLKNPENLIIGQTDLDGHVIVQLAPVGSQKDYDPEAAKKGLLNYNAANTKDLGDNKVMLSGITDLDIINSNGSQIRDFLPRFLRTLESTVTRTRKPASTAYAQGVDNRYYRVTVIPNTQGGFIYSMVDKEKPKSPIYSTTNKNEMIGIVETRITTKQQIQTK